MEWLLNEKPESLEKIYSNKDEIEKAKNWIESYIKNSENCKKILLIMGDSGIGKTLLANIILKQYNYNLIEINSSDIRSQKKLSEFLKKSLSYNNVLDMFYNGTKPIGILIDEIDTLCKINDKGGLSEFINIIKINDKISQSENKSKQKKSDDYIKLYNPIICTSSLINDKKINELKKFSEVIVLKKNSFEDDLIIINELYDKYKVNIDDNVKLLISNHCKGDIRKLICLLNELYIYSNGNKINSNIFLNFTKSFTEKHEDLQLINTTKKIFDEKLDPRNANIYFDVDNLLMPLMIYHNSLNYIKNTENINKKKISVYKNILNSLSFLDNIQTNIFETQDWNELYNISSFYSVMIPNHYAIQLKNKKEVNIEFTSLLNKISQMFVNKKLINEAKSSIGKINYDTDEIIYITEILSNYLNDFSNYDFDQIDEEIIKKDNLIIFMKKYNIEVEHLENLLKIEKLNKNLDKKKKFTIKIKKILEKYIN